MGIRTMVYQKLIVLLAILAVVTFSSPCDDPAIEEFKAPTCSADSYYSGDVVTYDGNFYTSLIDGNVWAPSLSSNLWSVISCDGEEIIPEWERPISSLNSYNIGSKVLFDGAIFESKMDGNVWSPAEYPPAWTLIEKQEDKVTISLLEEDTIFNLQKYTLYAKGYSNPDKRLVDFKWKQLSGTPVTLENDDDIYCSFMSNSVGVLSFELALTDPAGTFSTIYDTITIFVKETQALYDFVSALQIKNASEEGVTFTITHPTMEQSIYTIDDKINLKGTVNTSSAYGTILWTSKNINGTTSGVFNVEKATWALNDFNVAIGDNEITLVYTSVDGKKAVDRLLVTRGNISLNNVKFNPEVFWFDSMMTFNPVVSLSDQNIESVKLLRVTENAETVVCQYNDNGVSGDVQASDLTYTGEFTFTPKEDSVYHYRVEVIVNGTATRSEIISIHPLTPYSDELWNRYSAINSQANTMYWDKKSMIDDSIDAMMEVVEWLSGQEDVVIAGINSGNNAICWRYKSGVSVTINDAPEGTLASDEKNRIGGVSPLSWDMSGNDIMALGSTFDELAKNDALIYSSSDKIINSTVNNIEPFPSTYENWDEYKVIMLQTHGNTFGYMTNIQDRDLPAIDLEGKMSIWENPYLYIMTSRNVYDDDVLDLWMELIAADIQPYPSVVNVYYKDYERIALTPKFFKNQSLNLDETLILFSVCRGLYNDDFWNIFYSKSSSGTAAMLGFTDYVTMSWAPEVSKILISELNKKNVTLDSAMNYTVTQSSLINYGTNGREWPADYRYLNHNLPNPARFEYRGDGDFELPHQEKYYFQMKWYNAAGESKIYVNDNLVATYGGYYPPVAPPVLLDSIESFEDIKIGLTTFWRNRLYGPVYDDNTRFFSVVEEGDTVTYTFGGAEAYNYGYDDGQFIIYRE